MFSYYTLKFKVQRELFTQNSAIQVIWSTCHVLRKSCGQQHNDHVMILTFNLQIYKSDFATETVSMHTTFSCRLKNYYCNQLNIIQNNQAGYVWVIDQAWGQDGWILAKFFQVLGQVPRLRVGP